MSSEKNITERMCIACKQMQDKQNLLRIVKFKDGSVCLDKSRKMQGRGAYVCKKKECIEKCIKNKLLNKTFKCKTDESIYESLKTEIGENE